jgi:uncharacterized protein YukE
MANNTEAFHQDSGASVSAAGVIETGAKRIGLDGASGHIGELREILNKLAGEWHSGASIEHAELMKKWQASVTRLAELTKAVSTDMRTGTDNLATATNSMNTPNGGGGGGGGHIAQGLRG